MTLVNVPRCGWWSLAVAFVCAGAAGAQTLPRTGLACNGELVTRIDVRRYPPFASNSTSSIGNRFARIATKLHATTKDKLIRRYLALQVGAPCTELRRAESERILRAQPYLADAEIVTYSDGAGGVVVDVMTVDEVSLVVGGRLTSQRPYVRSVRLGEANLMGEGLYVAADWRDRAIRDAYAVTLIHYQFLGRPYQMAITAGRRELGGDWAVEASHPFLTDLQRISWRTTVGSIDDYAHFRRTGAPAASLRLERAYSDIGGVVRVGPPGRFGLIGGSLSHEVERVGDAPVVIADSMISPDTSQALFNRYPGLRATRANMLWGFRTVHFLRVTGFDALDGVQDVRKGVQFGSLVGRSMKALGGAENDFFVSSYLYVAKGSEPSFASLEVLGEGRRDMDDKQWDGMLGSGRLAWYLRPLPRHRLISSVEWGAGIKQRIPFQLSFADREGGLRGYRESELTGGRRLVTRLEDRYVWGRFKQLATVGLAGFVDAGKLWQGDVPFGRTTGVKAGAGFSILAAVPPRSQRLWRADVAFPLNGDRAAKWEIRFSSTDVTRSVWREPGDVRNVRERSVPINIFNWP